MRFSVEAFSQLQFKASFCPQEHFACAAQVQGSPELLQQVGGWTILTLKFKKFCGFRGDNYFS
jgi:hypothetical protein